MLISSVNKSQKNISKIFAVFSLMLICPLSSFAADDFCCAIPEESPSEKTVKHLSFTDKDIKFYPRNISRQLLEKHQKAINDYNTFVDKSSALGSKHNSSQFSVVSKVLDKFSKSKQNVQKTFSSGSSWLGTFYEKFLSPQIAEASEIKGIYSLSQLKSILNKKHSFQKNSLVKF